MAVIFILPAALAAISSGDGVRLPAPPSEGGTLPTELNVYFSDEGQTRAIGIEEYVKGVLPAEMPALFAPEAQKAQAVAARTYVYHKYLNYVKDPAAASPAHPDAAVCTDPAHCNAYYSEQQLIQRHGQKWAEEYLAKIRSYADDTAGEILVYDDEPILAVFHAASAGGATEASGDVWARDLPYLVSVKSAGEEAKAGFVSAVSVSRQEFTAKIKESFPNAEFSENSGAWIGERTRTQANHIDTITVGGAEIKGTQIRAMFGLKSTYFDIAVDEKNVTFTVQGAGHGVGMSQYGANHMAENGADYKQILENYYSGAKIVKY
jgi:stage II sporulation protein D